jgi:hypothetical protein
MDSRDINSNLEIFDDIKEFTQELYKELDKYEENY